MNEEEPTPADRWKPPNRLQRGLARVRKGWSDVWKDTRILNGSREVSLVEFVAWSPVMVALTPVLFVMGMTDPPPVPMLLACPSCGVAHVDRGSWRTRLHRTHRCESCGIEWRPTDYPTVGI